DRLAILYVLCMVVPIVVVHRGAVPTVAGPETGDSGSSSFRILCYGRPVAYSKGGKNRQMTGFWPERGECGWVKNGRGRKAPSRMVLCVPCLLFLGINTLRTGCIQLAANLAQQGHHFCVI